MRKRNRSINSGALAFLDIMACGLGAVILVFMMAKKQPEPLDLPDPTPKIAAMAALKDEEASLLSELDAITDAQQDAQSGMEGLEARLETLNADIADGVADLEKAKLALSEIQEAIKNAPPLQTNDVIELDQGGEETYLTGLKVEGRRMVFMVDASTSMTDYRVVDILKRKSGQPSLRMNGPKWQRTLRTVDWLMARVPQGSQFQVIAFSEKARSLSNNEWLNGRDKAAIERMRRALRGIDPKGGTNLQDGFDLFNRQRGTHLYLITDGMPTMGNSRYRSLNPFANCNALTGNGSVISGDCRVKLFRQTLIDSRPARNVVNNVILMPLEGDSSATLEYWSLTAASGGQVISPAANWP